MGQADGVRGDRGRADKSEQTGQAGAAASGLAVPDPRPGATAARRWVPGGDSGWWIALVAAAYTIAQLLTVPAGLGLSWDESVYASQVTAGGPASPFSAPRARGIPLLLAPVTELTTSTAALRVYLAILSGLGLLAALWAWRTLRPAWTVALAGLLFAGLWVTQFYGPQAMPNLWVALSGLAAVGCFLRVSSAGPSGLGAGAQAGLVGSLAVAALVRPSDALWLALPLLVAALLARPRPGRGTPSAAATVTARAGPAAAWRWRGRLAGLVIVGLAAGAAEWAAEASARFGGLTSRMHLASQAEGGFGAHFAVFDELKALNGPTLCRPCTIGWKYPELSLWWFVLPVLAALGVLVSTRVRRYASGADHPEPSVLPALCGACAAIPYLLLIGFGAPRFLLPAYALLAIPVADGLGWLMLRPSGPAGPGGFPGGSPGGMAVRPGAVTAVVAALAVQLAVQHLVLDRTVHRTMIGHAEFSRIVTDLRAIGVRPPCLLTGEQAVPVAFYARCRSAEIGGTDASITEAGRCRQVLAAGQHPGRFPVATRFTG